MVLILLWVISLGRWLLSLGCRCRFVLFFSSSFCPKGEISNRSSVVSKMIKPCAIVASGDGKDIGWHKQLIDSKGSDVGGDYATSYNNTVNTVFRPHTMAHLIGSPIIICCMIPVDSCSPDW